MKLAFVTCSSRTYRGYRRRSIVAKILMGRALVGVC